MKTLTYITKMNDNNQTTVETEMFPAEYTLIHSDNVKRIDNICQHEMYLYSQGTGKTETMKCRKCGYEYQHRWYDNSR